MKNVLARGSRNLHKFRFYNAHALQRLLPEGYLVWRRRQLIQEFYSYPEPVREALLERVNYYQKNEYIEIENLLDCRSRLKSEKSRAYWFDLTSLLRYFPAHLNFEYIFGDVTQVPDRPAFVKSRPLATDNRNGVLLKLNQVRHYYFVRDEVVYEDKLDKAVWRGACHQPHRQAFVQAFHDHPLCNVGDVHANAKGKPWHRSFMSITEQLNYKFVLSIEGNDVATNLKWIMASNSLCMMRRPRFETWFMEGALLPSYHYVELKDDYSDLEEKMAYYTENPEEAKRIIHNANAYVMPFLNVKQERLLNILVLQSYFEASCQLEPVLQDV